MRTFQRAAACLLWLVAAPAAAQISTDGSLGAQVDLVLQSGEYQITDDLGRYAGANLFHSFSTFDVGSGETATFLAASGSPARVIARVTGGDGTRIAGTLRSAIAGADLFLLDSRGVTFDQGSSLEVDGSFHTSSADALRFESGPDFLSADATPDPLLSSAEPAAFGFTSLSPAQMILARTDRLSVPTGETLSIVGGNVFVLGDIGAPEIVIDAPGAQVQIASAAGPIDLPIALAGFDPDGVPSGSLGNIEFVAATALLSGTLAVPAGSVTIRGGQFVLSGGSAIVAQSFSDQDAAGPIDIAVSGDLRLLGNPSGIPQTLIQSWSRGNGAAGDVLLHGDRVEVSGGAQVQVFGTSTALTGSAPDAQLSGRVVEIRDGGEVLALTLSTASASRIGIQASERIGIENGAVVASELLPGHVGSAGDIQLVAPQVDIAGGAQVSTLNGRDGEGSAIGIDTDSLRVSDGGAILSESASPLAQGGLLDLVTGELLVTDAGRIASINAAGVGGDIAIDTDRLLVSNASGRPEGTFISADDGGAIRIDAGQVELVDGGQVITRAFADTPAGALSVVADSVAAIGVDAQDRPSGLFSRARENASPTASGGRLSIETDVLEVLDGAEISASTLGAADAGSVVIDASDRVTVRGGPNGVSLISAATAASTSTGAGGSVDIQTGQLELRDGGRVTTGTLGTGDAGSIRVDAGRIEVSGVDPLTGVNASGFFSTSNTLVAMAGDGGNIHLVASEGVRISDGGIVSATSIGTGLAGDIEIDGGERVVIENGTISTEALASTGGNVKITAGQLVYLLDGTVATDVLGGAGGGGDVTIDPVHTVLNRSSITARAVLGNGGNILIVTDHFFQSGDSILDPSSTLGIDGSIEITSPDTDVTGGLATLTAEFLDASAMLERDCAARTERAGSFTVRTRAALADPPDALSTPADAASCEEGLP